MGELVSESWTSAEEAPLTQRGAFARPQLAFNNSVEPGGRFSPQAGRYPSRPHSPAPWRIRTLIFRRLELDSPIGFSVTHWLMVDEGWTFAQGEVVHSDAFDVRASHEIYPRPDSNYTGRVSVSVLWDTGENTIVSNEFADKIGMFNSGFDAVGAEGDDNYPQPKRAEINALMERSYATVNNGVYKAEFGRTQKAQDTASLSCPLRSIGLRRGFPCKPSHRRPSGCEANPRMQHSSI